MKPKLTVITNTFPKEFRPFCGVCGWRMGGPDSWDGKACKCGNSAPPQTPIRVQN